MLNKLHRGDKVPSGKSVAVLAIKDAASMTPAGRKVIAKWLRSHADLILAEGYNYAPKFRGRYLVEG